MRTEGLTQEKSRRRSYHPSFGMVTRFLHGYTYMQNKNPDLTEPCTLLLLQISNERVLV